MRGEAPSIYFSPAGGVTLLTKEAVIPNIAKREIRTLISIPHFPYQPCRACRNQQQNYLM